MTNAKSVSREAVWAAGRRVVRAAGVATSPLRPPPDFLLIGTKRGGSTSLFRHIETHPSFLPLFPSARVLPLRENQKGVHYFDTGFTHSTAWYRSHFPTWPARLARRRRTGAAFQR